MKKPIASLSPLHHRGAKHIKVVIKNNPTSKNLIRTVKGRKWSKTHTCWYVPYTKEAFEKLQSLFEVNISNGENEMEGEINYFKNLKKTSNNFNDGQNIYSLNSEGNIKYNCLKVLMNIEGISLKEIINLKLTNIIPQPKTTLLNNRKHYLTFSEKTLLNLQKYYLIYAPKYWLFEDQNGNQYSEKKLKNLLSLN